MNRVWVSLAVVLVLSIVGITWLSVSRESDARLAGRRQLTLQLQWYPQAQFVGFYVASAKGFYAEEGLSLTFLHGGPDVNPIRNVTDNQAQIGLATADQVLVWTDQNRDPGRELKAIGAVFNESIGCFMSKSTLGIKSPADLQGKTIGVFPSYDTEHLLLCLLSRFKIRTDQVSIINFPSLVQFQNDDVQVFGAYSINEPVWAKLHKTEVNILRPSDYGVTFYSDTIVTRRDFYRDNRDVLIRFLRASSRGWSYAEQNPQEAVALMYDVVRGSMGEGLPREHQEGMCLEAVKHLRAGPKDLNFHMEKSRWDDMEASLKDIGRLNNTGHVSTLCDFTIVEEAMQ